MSRDTASRSDRRPGLHGDPGQVFASPRVGPEKGTAGPGRMPRPAVTGFRSPRYANVASAYGTLGAFSEVPAPKGTPLVSFTRLVPMNEMTQRAMM
jgi:hypothetical protein